jgi:hypothetical protein
VTDSFSRLEWEAAAKGQRSAPGPHYRPAGRYVLVKDFGIPNLPGFLPKGSSVYLTAEEATRMKDYIEEEVRER